MRVMLKSKIHRATITDANIDYEGSITIDKKLMTAADILPYEQVHVLNITNGHRFTTYAIEGETGDICLNGAAALLANKGDLVIILTYATVNEAEARSLKPKVVLVDSKNIIRNTKNEILSGSVIPAKAGIPELK